MSKKIDWNSTYTEPFRRNLSGQSGARGKYGSGKEKMQKAFADMKEQEVIKENLNKMLPAMQQLLLIRMKNKTPLKVMRPLRYTTHELQKGNIQGQAVATHFVDVVKVINPGTELVLKSLDHNLQQFIFQTSNGEEIEMNYAEQENLLMQTDVYETVCNLTKQGELK